MTVIEQFSEETLNLDQCRVQVNTNHVIGDAGCFKLSRLDAMDYFIPQNGLVLWEVKEDGELSPIDILDNYVVMLATSLELTKVEQGKLYKCASELKNEITSSVRPVNIYSRGGIVDHCSQATLYFMVDTGLYFLPTSFRGDFATSSTWYYH